MNSIFLICSVLSSISLVSSALVCAGVSSSTYDAWCTATCNAVPAVCPSDICACGAAVSVPPSHSMASTKTSAPSITASITPSPSKAVPCYALVSTTTNAWCTTSCNANPPFCPNNTCVCGVPPSISSSPSRPPSSSALPTLSPSRPPSSALPTLSPSRPPSSSSSIPIPSSSPKFSCVSLVATTTDSWCTNNCNSNPPYCPSSYCTCLDLGCGAGITPNASNLCCPGQTPNAIFLDATFDLKKNLKLAKLAKSAPTTTVPVVTAPSTLQVGYTFATPNGNIIGFIPVNVAPEYLVCVPNYGNFVLYSVANASNNDGYAGGGFTWPNGTTIVELFGPGTIAADSFSLLNCEPGVSMPVVFGYAIGVGGSVVISDCSGNTIQSFSILSALSATTLCLPYAAKVSLNGLAVFSAVDPNQNLVANGGYNTCPAAAGTKDLQ